jgi:nucleoside-diphosphate-sugar epimerase
VADILITGATGFVGSHLAEALARHGVTARALVRGSSDVSVLRRFGIGHVRAELGDATALRHAVEDAHTVVHLAAATRALSRQTFQDVNVDGTRRIIEAMQEGGAQRRLIYLSSLAAVGPSTDGPVRPDSEPRPLTTYGRTKLEGERLALGASGLTAAVLRPPAVYGPGDRDLLTFFRMARLGILPVIGPGARRVQLIHARDVAEALVGAVEERSAAGIFHIADPTAYAWSEVLDRVAVAVGRRGVRVRIPAAALKGVALATQLGARVTGRPATLDGEKVRELLAEGWLCETEAARRAFGFVSAIPLAHGLRETADWYRSEGWL